MVKMFVGSVTDVFRKLGFDEHNILELEKNQGVEINKRQIEINLVEVSFVDLERTFTDLEAEVKSDAVYQHPYASGSLNAPASAVYQAYLDERKTELEAQYGHLPIGSEDYIRVQQELNELDSDTKKHSCAFVYHDDEGRLCAFELVYHANQPNTWILQINRNIVAPLNQRTTSLFLTDEGFSKKVGVEESVTELHHDIKQCLNSKVVSQLINGLLDQEGQISHEKFQELKARLQPEQNLDNRDFKIKQLNELMVLAEVKWSRLYLLAENATAEDENRAFQLFLEPFRLNMLSQVNFFNDENYLENLEKLRFAIELMINNVKDQTLVKRGLYELKLTKAAIDLELYAQTKGLVDNQRDALLEQANALRKERDNPSSTIKEIVLDQLIQEAYLKLPNEHLIKSLQRIEADLDSLRQTYRSEAQLAFIASISAVLEEVKQRQTEADELTILTMLNATLVHVSSILEDPTGKTVFSKLGLMSYFMTPIWPDELNPVKENLVKIKKAVSLLNIDKHVVSMKEVIKTTKCSSLVKGMARDFCATVKNFYQTNLSTLSSENQVALLNMLTAYQDWFVHSNVFDFRNSMKIRFLTMNAEDDTLPEIREWKQWSMEQQALSDHMMEQLGSLEQNKELKTLTTELQRNRTRLPLLIQLTEKIKLFQDRLDAIFGSINGVEDARLVEHGEEIIKDIFDLNDGNLGGLTEEKLTDLNAAIDHCIAGISYLYDRKNIINNEAKIKENFAKLAELSQKLPGHESPGWKKLGKSLLYFAGLALVVVGVLAAIPSGGSSLLLLALGTVGITVGSTAAGVAIGVGASVGTGIAGLSFFNANSASGVAKEVTEFGKSLEHKVQTELDEQKQIVKKAQPPQMTRDNEAEDVFANEEEKPAAYAVTTV